MAQRLPGDVVFAAGAVLRAWDFIAKLRPLSRPSPAVIDSPGASMFCPECGMVIASGPLDLRRASHGTRCTIDQSVGLRLGRVIRRMFRRGQPIEDQPPHSATGMTGTLEE